MYIYCKNNSTKIYDEYGQYSIVNENGVWYIVNGDDLSIEDGPFDSKLDAEDQLTTYVSLLDDPRKSPSKYTFTYDGPAYRFDEYLGDFDIETTARSLGQAKKNIQYQIKSILNLKPNSKIDIDEDLIVQRGK